MNQESLNYKQVIEYFSNLKLNTFWKNINELKIIINSSTELEDEKKRYADAQKAGLYFKFDKERLIQIKGIFEQFIIGFVLMDLLFFGSNWLTIFISAYILFKLYISYCFNNANDTNQDESKIHKLEFILEEERKKFLKAKNDAEEQSKELEKQLEQISELEKQLESEKQRFTDAELAHEELIKEKSFQHETEISIMKFNMDSLKEQFEKRDAERISEYQSLIYDLKLRIEELEKSLEQKEIKLEKSLEPKEDKLTNAQILNKICKICGDKVQGQVISALDQDFHPNCFNCCICTRNLSTKEVPFISDEENNIYCQPDYHK